MVPSPTQNEIKLIRKRPGRPPKNKLDMELEIYIAEAIDEPTEKIKALKRKKSSKTYREKKNMKLSEAMVTVEDYQKERERLQGIYDKNEKQIKNAFKLMEYLIKNS